MKININQNWALVIGASCGNQGDSQALKMRGPRGEALGAWRLGAGARRPLHLGQLMAVRGWGGGCVACRA